eukprot:PhF_6_TR8896/c0_g1_i1/m.14059
MVFVVNVATDLYGRKENLRFDFTTRPTMSELINTTESQYDVMARSTRPTGYPDIPFRVQTFQVYDDVLMRWVDLYHTDQLTNGCQAYAFQPDTIWNPDLQGTIPIPKETITWASTVGSPRRARLPQDHGVPPSSSEKLRAVFAELDIGNKGYVLYSDLRAAFQRNDMEFTYSTVGELFNRADANRDGNISYEEWVRFAIDYPNLIDALFFRSRDGTVTRPYYTSVTDELLSQRRARELELDRMYRDAEYSRRRAEVEQTYASARRELEVAQEQLQASARREREAREQLYYTPTSPRYGYR